MCWAVFLYSKPHSMLVAYSSWVDENVFSLSYKGSVCPSCFTKVTYVNIHIFHFFVKFASLPILCSVRTFHVAILRVHFLALSRVTSVRDLPLGFKSVPSLRLVPSVSRVLSTLSHVTDVIAGDEGVQLHLYCCYFLLCSPWLTMG